MAELVGTRWWRQAWMLVERGDDECGCVVVVGVMGGGCVVVGGSVVVGGGCVVVVGVGVVGVGVEGEMRLVVLSGRWPRRALPSAGGTMN